MNGVGIYIGPVVAIGAGIVIGLAVLAETLIARHRERAEIAAQADLDAHAAQAIVNGDGEATVIVVTYYDERWLSGIGATFGGDR